MIQTHPIVNRVNKMMLNLGVGLSVSFHFLKRRTSGCAKLSQHCRSMRGRSGRPLIKYRGRASIGRPDLPLSLRKSAKRLSQSPLRTLVLINPLIEDAHSSLCGNAWTMAASNSVRCDHDCEGVRNEANDMALVGMERDPAPTALKAVRMAIGQALRTLHGP